jgi:hypothetical protein
MISVPPARAAGGITIGGKDNSFRRGKSSYCSHQAICHINLGTPTSIELAISRQHGDLREADLQQPKSEFGNSWSRRPVIICSDVSLPGGVARNVDRFATPIDLDARRMLKSP